MFPYLPFYSVWPYTPAIPAFYWNAKSQEEIIKHIACEIDHITAYLDEIITDINKTLNDYDTRIKNIETKVDTYTKIVEELQTILENIGDSMLMYDVTQGKYVDTKTATRNLYRELSTNGTRVSQIAEKTVDEITAHRVIETSAIGNITIFNKPTPRVTDKSTGDDYTPLGV